MFHGVETVDAGDSLAAHLILHKELVETTDGSLSIDPTTARSDPSHRIWLTS